MVASIRGTVSSAPPLRWAGVVVWLVAVLVIQAPLQERILLLAPLVVVPMLLALLPPRTLTPSLSSERLGPWPLAAAMLLPLATALPRGPLAGTLTLPWLALAVLLAVSALRHTIAGVPAILGRGRAADLATDAALVGLAVGAGWLWVDRMGIVVPGIAPLIGTLTAVHFHVAAFGLVGIGALLAAARPGRAVWLASVALVVGIWLTAAGFVLPSRDLGWLGALLVGASGLLVAGLLAGRPGGLAVRAACLALAVGMVLAIAWPTSLALAPGVLDIDLMVRTHGVLNATAVTLLAWTARTWMGDAR